MNQSREVVREVVRRIIALIDGGLDESERTEVSYYYFDGGEYGMALEASLRFADRDGVQLPPQLLEAAALIVEAPRMFPPGTDLDRLRGIIASSLDASRTAF